MLQAPHSLSSALEHLKSFQEYNDLRAFVIYLLQHINKNSTSKNFNERIAEITAPVQSTWIDKNLSAAFLQAAQNVKECLNPHNAEFLFPEANSKIIVRQYEEKRKRAVRLDSGSYSDSETNLLADDLTEEHTLLGNGKKSKKRYSNLL